MAKLQVTESLLCRFSCWITCGPGYVFEHHAHTRAWFLCTYFSRTPGFSDGNQVFYLWFCTVVLRKYNLSVWKIRMSFGPAYGWRIVATLIDTPVILLICYCQILTRVQAIIFPASNCKPNSLFPHSKWNSYISWELNTMMLWISYSSGALDLLLQGLFLAFTLHSAPQKELIFFWPWICLLKYVPVMFQLSCCIFEYKNAMYTLFKVFARRPPKRIF